MADDIVVRFGAQIQGLVTGVTEARESIESLRAPVDNFVAGLGGIAEAIGAAFVVDKIKEFATEMAELGEKALNSSAVLGLSLSKYAQLTSMLQLAGANADTAQRALERLAVALIKAADPASREAAGFRNLGYTQQQVAASTQDLGVALDILAAKYAAARGGPALIAAMTEVLSRRLLDALIPALRRGSEGLEELKKMSAEAAATFVEFTPVAADTEEKLKLLRQEASILAEKTFIALKGAIDAVIISLTKLLGWIPRAGAAAANAAADFIHWTNALLGTAQGLDAVSAAAERNRNARGIGSKEGAYALLPPKEPPEGTRPPGTDKGGKGGKKESDDRMSAWRDELRQKLEADQNFFSDSKAEELAFWQQKLATISSGSRQDLKLRREVNAEIFALEKGLARQTEQNAIEEQTYKARVADVVYTGKKEHLDAEIALGKITATAGIAEEQRLLDEKQALDEQYFEAKLAAASKDANETKKILEEEYLAYQEYQNKRQALDDKAAEDAKKAADKAAQPFISAFDQIGSTFESMITGMITRSSTLQQGLKKLWSGILGDFTKMIGDMLSQWAASGLANLLGVSATGAGGGALGIGGVLGSALGGLFKGGAGGGGGGIGGFLSGLPLIGGLFGGGGGGASYGAAVDLGLFSRGGIVSAAGGWSVPSTGVGGTLAQLHPNEMVLPAEISKGLQGMIAGGGGGDQHFHAHFHGPADAPAIQAWFKKNLSSNSATLRQMAFQSAFTGRNLSTNTG